MQRISRLALIGFGQDAKTMLEMGLNRHNRVITAFDFNTLEPTMRRDLLADYIHHNVQGCISLQDAIRGTHLIFLLDNEKHISDKHKKDEIALIKNLIKHIKNEQIVLDLTSRNLDEKTAIEAEIKTKDATYLIGQLMPSAQQDTHLIISHQAAEIRKYFESLNLRVDIIKNDPLTENNEI
ncbi:MAG: hypothetical protein ACK5NC_06620 [Vibrio sp.]